ncbi:hypothetical protein VTK56DRAFT_3868 [Thermocarpiscus australiensis]
MEPLGPVLEDLTFFELLKGLVISVVLGRFLVLPSRRVQVAPGHRISSTLSTEITKTAGFFFIFLTARSWLALVDRYVPEPYLDEVFHIPQAQRYCEGRFRDWDDKITTPPGLYLLSVAYHRLWMLAECTPFSLRSNNLLATLLTALLASQCRHLIEDRAAEREGKRVSQGVSFYAYHTGLNIALFPVIFFFSALYYTDVVSTLVVLAAYRNHLLRLGPQTPGLASGIWTVVLGIAALFMRQTNVFWVVVYMGGSEAVHALQSLKPATHGSLGEVHDPPLDRSGPEDWLLCILTLATAAALNPARVLRQIWPYITVLTLFAGFVFWNGGVVLGDKSNHVATIHLAQMLYIWPFFAFFSGPLFIPSIFALITIPFRYLQSLRDRQPGASPRKRNQIATAKTSTSSGTRSSALIDIPYALLTLLLSLAVVKYNTIIHPFTLADNRHYMFYIFRYTILRSPSRRVSLVAAYTLCRWLAWDQLSRGSTATDADADEKPNNPQRNVPVQPTPPPSSYSSSLAVLDTPIAGPASSTRPSTSTALVWLLATSLSLITAPLVEPRYFILPWVFYRLLMPAWPVPAPSEEDTTGSCIPAWLWRVGRRIDLRLVLETVWFVAVNLGTMYMFLFRGFYWRGADGEVLDGGRVQRFMW